MAHMNIINPCTSGSHIEQFLTDLVFTSQEVDFPHESRETLGRGRAPRLTDPLDLLVSLAV